MTAGGPNEYGDDKPENRFPGPPPEKYFVIVNKKTGKTKVYNEEFGADKYIGEFDPETGKIKYNNNWWGGAKKEEKEFFENNKTLIKNQAKSIIISEAEGTPAEKLAEANKLMRTPQGGETTEGTLNASVESDQEGTGTTAFVYPENLRFERQDTMTFTSLVYHTTGFNIESARAFQERKETSQIKERLSSIILPIPGGITSANTTDWSKGSDMNALEAAGAAVLLEAGKKGSAEAGLKVAQSKVTSAIQGATGKLVKEGLLNAIAGAATGKGTQMLQRTTGMVLNPNMEALFSGPALRDFTFNFTLTPRSASEGKVILQIIRLFKQAMAPQRSVDHLFLKTPNTFEIKYSHNGQEHHALNKFKECALTACTVEYTPSANYSTYKDGVMTQYTMELRFKELVPIYNDDYGTNVSAEIGF